MPKEPLPQPVSELDKVDHYFIVNFEKLLFRALEYTDNDVDAEYAVHLTLDSIKKRPRKINNMKAYVNKSLKRMALAYKKRKTDPIILSKLVTENLIQLEDDVFTEEIRHDLTEEEAKTILDYVSKRLSPFEWKVVQMQYDGNSVQEISEELEKPTNKVRKAIERVRKKFSRKGKSQLNRFLQ